MGRGQGTASPALGITRSEAGKITQQADVGESTRRFAKARSALEKELELNKHHWCHDDDQHATGCACGATRRELRLKQALSRKRAISGVLQALEKELEMNQHHWCHSDNDTPSACSCGARQRELRLRAAIKRAGGTPPPLTRHGKYHR